MKSEESVYLVVLCHGLWGNKSHMDYIEKQISEKYKDDNVHVLNSSVNEAKYSYDGVDICGERLADDVEATIVRLGKNGKKVKKISIMGYSLGGLITRYAIGVLGQRGLFNTIEPEYFITFATPHMGVKLPSNSIFPTIFKFISGRFVSRSGDQLQLRDKYEKYQNKPLLEVLSDPNYDYFKYLSKFKTKRSYANVSNDRTVPYWSSGMEIKDYFYNRKGKLDISLDETYMSIITAFDVRSPDRQKKKSKDKKNPNVTKYVFYLLFPVIAPFFFTFALSMISIQGIISRIRVHQLLHKKQALLITSDTSRRRSSVDYVEGELLTGALDAINIPSDEGDRTPTANTSNNHESDSSDETLSSSSYYYNVEASKELEAIVKPLKFDDVTLRIHENLNLLGWERVYVYIKAMNAHASIVCRQKRFTNDGGKATIQHFIDTTHFKL